MEREGKRIRNKSSRVRDRYGVWKANDCGRRGVDMKKGKIDSTTWSEVRSKYTTRLTLFTYICWH